MDEYLSRRIKNWGAWQHPDSTVRARLLELAAGRTPEPSPVDSLRTSRQWLGLIFSPSTPEKNLFANTFSRHNQLAILNLEIIYRNSPLRYA